jgi:hypothetical protein
MIVAPSFRGGCLFVTVNLLERKQTLLVDHMMCTRTEIMPQLA